MTTTPQSSVPSAPTREEVDKLLASFEGCTPVALPVSVDDIIGDCTHGQYRAYAVFDANGKSICDTLNCDLICLEEDADEDGFRRWDEAGRKNMEWIAARLNAAPQLVEWVRELSADHARLGEELRRVTQFSGTCGLSTDGISLFGDEQSIKQVKEWMYQAQSLPQVRQQLLDERDRLTAQLSAQSGEVERLRMALSEIDAHQFDDGEVRLVINLSEKGFWSAIMGKDGRPLAMEWKQHRDEAIAYTGHERPTSPSVSDEQGEVK